MKDGAKITVEDSLTGDAPVARITVPNGNYQVGTQVLTGSNNAAISSNHLKFSVTRGGTPEKNWYVDTDGKLTNNITDIFNNITQKAIQNVESSMNYTSSTGINPKDKLEGKLLLYKTSEAHYGIMYVTEVNTSGQGYIKFNYKTFDSSGGVLKSENDKEVSGGYQFDLDNGNDDDGSDFWLDGINKFQPLSPAKFYVLP